MIQSLSMVLEDGQSRDWTFDFSDYGTLRMRNFESVVRLPWVRLECWRCPACSLEKGTHPMCPVAVVLAQYACDLADHSSYERVTVHFTEAADRQTVIEGVPLQRVVGELVRLAVFQSQCPVGRRVKAAMVHLAPFPTSQDILRALALFFAVRSGNQDGPLNDEQVQFMRALHDVFGHLSKRLENAGAGDVYLNGVVILHSLSVMFSLSAPELIQNAITEYRA